MSSLSRKTPLMVLALTVLTFVLPHVVSAPLSPMDVSKIKRVTQVAMSPDGTKVAYVLQSPRSLTDDENGSAWAELHVADVATGSSRAYVAGEVNISDLIWSPDGQHVGYLAKRGEEHKTVWAIPVAGGESTQLVDHGAAVKDFSWHPDGSKVAFVANEPKSEERKKLVEKGFNQQIYEEDNTAQRVYVASIEEAKPAKGSELAQIDGHAWHVAYSPDGSRLAVDLAPTPLVDDQYMSRRVTVVNAESGKLVGKIANPGKLGKFDWLPDGKTIAMISGIDINDPKEGRLMVAPASGGAPRDLLPSRVDEIHIDDFSIASDGSIIYLAANGASSEIGKVGLDGRAETWHESSSPVYFSLSGDAAGKQLALVGEASDMPRELMVFARNASSAKRLTNSNPWLSRVDLAPQKIIEYKSRDGWTIEGMLIEPLEKAAGKLPLIVVAHGGPEAHYKNGWLTRYSGPGQMAAGQGYAVFYPNYRSSTGRGVKFSTAGQGDGGGKEFLDVIDGVDHLVKTHGVDRKRVGITGGSYGGFFTALGSTRYSEHFAAGVMFVGISNQLSKTGTTDIFNEMKLVHWLTTPYENIDLFLDRSPVMHVDKANTPLLIMHGKDDPRVNVGQSRELYRAIKYKGDVPVRLVLYPGEKHGNRKAAAQYDYNLRMLRWFDHFLKNGGKDLPPWKLEYGLDD